MCTRVSSVFDIGGSDIGIECGHSSHSGVLNSRQSFPRIAGAILVGQYCLRCHSVRILEAFSLFNTFSLAFVWHGGSHGGKVARILIKGLNGGSPHARRVELQSRSPAVFPSPTPSPPANALPHGACKVHWPPPVVRSGRTRRHVHNVRRRSSAAAAGRRRGDALHQ